MKVSILLMSVATASALFGAAGPLSVGAGEDYGGAAAEWKPSFKARGSTARCWNCSAVIE